MPLACVNPGLKHKVLALRTVKDGILDRTVCTPNHRGCSALQGHGAEGSHLFQQAHGGKESGKISQGTGAGGSPGGSSFATVDPSRSRCLGYSRGEENGPREKGC